MVTWVSDFSRNKLRGGAWASQQASRGRVGWRSRRLDLARGGQQLKVGFAVVALGSQSCQSDLISLLIFWLFWVCDFCGFTVVVGGVFELPWLWLGLSWVVGSCCVLWVWETVVVARFVVGCGWLLWVVDLSWSVYLLGF